MKTPNPKKRGGKEKPKKEKPKTVEQLASIPENPQERSVREKEAYVAFVRWTILTVAERKAQKEPRTQGEFAKKWDVWEGTLSEWKDRSDFQKIRAELFRKKLAAEVPEVMADLRKRIKKYGMGMDVELWLAYSEGWDRKKVVEIKPPLEFAEGDVRALIAKLPKDKQKLYYVTIAKLLADARDANDEL